MTPTTSPPSASAASATSVMRPVPPPPYTSPIPRRASVRPIRRAASAYSGLVPDDEPQNTHTRFMRPSLSDARARMKRRSGGDFPAGPECAGCPPAAAVPIVASMTTETRAEIVSPPRTSRLGALWSSLVGKKALMAATGIVLFAFVLGHMLGNLQAFEGPAALNRYAQLLRIEPPLLWTVRIVLLAAVIVHAVAGIQLWAARRSARPIAYRQYEPSASTPASRTMIWSGFLILGFVVYHLLDLTFGVANPEFRRGDVFHNLVASLGRAAAAIFYVLAVAGLGVHLWHGLWSMFQSLGISNRAYTPGIQRFAVAFAVLLGVGFAAVPLAVLLGVIGG